MQMLVQLKVVQSSSLRKRVWCADVGSAKSSSVKQSQEKGYGMQILVQLKVVQSSSLRKKGTVCRCWFS